MRLVLPALALACYAGALAAEAPPSFSGIYPHLAMFNGGNECGTGAVVPWADKLWVVTYAPHSPKGSDDKLYSIDSALRQIIHPESIGGTPANRFIHTESQQLFIGPYAVDAQGKVRAIPYSTMFGRPTGNARHLTDPANKIYYASMEEGLYEVDVRTLAVTELWRDEQLKDGRKSDLPGYHGKGLYSGQGVLVYANNGEHGKDAQAKPDIPSGVLASWDGQAEAWSVVRRNQFTEVTGPGGLTGNKNPATDPLWSIGWDFRSLILMVRDATGSAGGPPAIASSASTVGGALRPESHWHTYRLPKSSHSYDGAHGWNTEWPRIRDIGENDLLMTMHGAFWRFPKNFDSTHSAGLSPRSNYLKVIGDFTRWGDRVVLGCDDTAKSEFLNKRAAKGKLAAPGQSQSNLWFVAPAQLDRLGPVIGRGAVWLNDAVKQNAPSDAFLFSGYDERLLHLTHDAATSVTFTLEVDRSGNGTWTELRRVEVPATGYTWTAFASSERAAWIRLRASRDLAHVTAAFAYRNHDTRTTAPDARFGGLGETGAVGALLHARGAEKKTLGVTVGDTFYEMGADMQLRRTEDSAAATWAHANLTPPSNAIALDAASVIYTDEQGKRWRLPRGRADFDGKSPHGLVRVDREVCTERDLLNAGGTFFEFPAENAGGIAKVRPIATHNRQIHDYASWRGLLVLSGVASNSPTSHPHLIRSADGKAGVWVGAVDDLWSFGKPVGVGGPWKNASVTAATPSDPYLLTGYDRKKLSLSHTATNTVRIRVEVDLSGTGLWVTYATLDVPPAQPLLHTFPAGYQAYWLRVTADTTTVATAQLVYD